MFTMLDEPIKPLKFVDFKMMKHPLFSFLRALELLKGGLFVGDSWNAPSTTQGNRLSVKWFNYCTESRKEKGSW